MATYMEKLAVNELEAGFEVLGGTKDMASWALNSLDKVALQPSKEILKGAYEAVINLPHTVKGVTLDTAVHLVSSLSNMIPATGLKIQKILGNFRPSSLKQKDGLFKAIGGALGAPIDLIKGLYHYGVEEAIGGSLTKAYDSYDKGIGVGVKTAIGGVRQSIGSIEGIGRELITSAAPAFAAKTATGLTRGGLGVFGKELQFKLQDNQQKESRFKFVERPAKFSKKKKKPIDNQLKPQEKQTPPIQPVPPIPRRPNRRTMN